jgi:hypothetical protein
VTSARGRGRSGRGHPVILPAGAPGSVIATIGRRSGNRGKRGRYGPRGGVCHIQARPQTHNAEAWCVSYNGSRRNFATEAEAHAALARYRAGECPCCGHHANPSTVVTDEEADDEASTDSDGLFVFNPAVFDEHYDPNHHNNDDDDHAPNMLTV